MAQETYVKLREEEQLVSTSQQQRLQEFAEYEEKMGTHFDRFKAMIKHGSERSGKGLKAAASAISDKKQRIEKQRIEKAKEQKKQRNELMRLLRTVKDCANLVPQDDDDDDDDDDDYELRKR